MVPGTKSRAWTIPYERGLENVTATYTLRKDSGIDVINRGYAFVSGYNRDYLWLLARIPDVDKEMIERFLDRANSLGFNTDEIILVDQKRFAN